MLHPKNVSTANNDHSPFRRKKKKITRRWSPDLKTRSGQTHKFIPNIANIFALYPHYPVKDVDNFEDEILCLQINLMLLLSVVVTRVAKRLQHPHAWVHAPLWSHINLIRLAPCPVTLPSAAWAKAIWCARLMRWTASWGASLIRQAFNSVF